MENKVVCSYCGTVYDASEEKCPLCGGRLCTPLTEETRPVQHQRLTEEERRMRRRKADKGGKYAASGHSSKKKPRKKAKEKNAKRTKSLLVTALVFLILAVAALTWFIGDMIGWWPGLEDLIDRDSDNVSVNVDQNCTHLELSDSVLNFSHPGEKAALRMSVNSGCTEKVTISFPDAAVASAEISKETEKGEELKTDTIVVTAMAEGSTKISFTCGEHSAVCEIRVGQSATAPVETQVSEETGAEPDASETPESTEPSEPVQPDEDFEPKLNFPEDLSLYHRGETVPLRVMNLPAGQKVTWSSDDETVAKVDKYGVVTAISGGSAKITAQVCGKTAEVLIRCPFDESGDVGAHLAYSDVTISVGETYYLYLLDIDDYRISDVVYTVDNEGVCSLEDGKVTGLTPGTATFTLTYNTKEYECIVRVVW